LVSEYRPQNCFELFDFRGNGALRVMRLEAQSQIHQVKPESQFFKCVLVHNTEIGGNAGRL
jgi:hypothetical protein